MTPKQQEYVLLRFSEIENSGEKPPGKPRPSKPPPQDSKPRLVDLPAAKPNEVVEAKCLYCGQLLGLGVTRCWSCGRVWPFEEKKLEPEKRAVALVSAVIRPRRFSWLNKGDA